VKVLLCWCCDQELVYGVVKELCDSGVCVFFFIVVLFVFCRFLIVVALLSVFVLFSLWLFVQVHL